ncbi:FUSC family protein [Peribacillus butanolivorans]|uniref:FUSC family protein n=1 Tax=Peribacillus butanolivorans TaxID=421767 RepID=UPI00207D217F|nr:FUSC family protein [Peribacillus butanolivorans]MCO0601120.1 FUSC family protein [Peribacillus butanolivorans]
MENGNRFYSVLGIIKTIGFYHPYLAPLTVILCLQSTIDITVQRSIQRVIGTMIGISVIVLIARHMSINGWNLGLLILLGCYITQWLKFNKTVIHQVALTLLFVFVLEHQTKHYAIDRMIDTLVGVIIAVLIQFVWFRLIFKRKQQAR